MHFLRTEHFRIIAAFTAVPLLALILVTFHQVAASFRADRQFQTLHRISASLEVTTDLIKALQVERGTSAGYLGSAGDAMAEALLSTRARTDAAQAAFDTNAPEIGGLADPTAALSVRDFEDLLARLGSHRAQIDAVSVSVEDSFGYYSSAIADLIDVASSTTFQARQTEFGSQLRSTLHLLTAVEHAGRERGLGAAALGAGLFSERQKLDFMAANARQRAEITLFLQAQPYEARLTFSGVLSGIPSATFETYLERMQQAEPGEGLAPLSASEWFDAASGRLDALDTVRASIVGSTESRLQEQSADQRDRLFYAIAIMIAALFVGGLSIAVWLRARTDGMKTQRAGTEPV